MLVGIEALLKGDHQLLPPNLHLTAAQGRDCHQYLEHCIGCQNTISLLHLSFCITSSNQQNERTWCIRLGNASRTTTWRSFRRHEHDPCRPSSRVSTFSFLLSRSKADRQWPHVRSWRVPRLPRCSSSPDDAQFPSTSSTRVERAYRWVSI